MKISSTTFAEMNSHGPHFVKCRISICHVQRPASCLHSNGGVPYLYQRNSAAKPTQDPVHPSSTFRTSESLLAPDIIANLRLGLSSRSPTTSTLPRLRHSTHVLIDHARGWGNHVGPHPGFPWLPSRMASSFGLWLKSFTVGLESWGAPPCWWLGLSMTCWFWLMFNHGDHPQESN